VIAQANAANDYLSLLPSTLQWISNRLDAMSVIPWPLWIGGLFPIYVAVVSVVLWLMRGRVWPVHCAYPKTTKGRDCRMLVAGEWVRCRHHNKRRHYKYGHEVDTTVQRWQAFDGKGRVVNRRELGVGVLRLRPAGSTLLYERGYARPVGAVLRLIPAKATALYQRIRAARLREPAPAVAEVETMRPGARTDIAEGLERVVQATRFATATFCVAIVCTLISVLLDGMPQTIFQYVATLGFVLAWAATSSGIYARSETWLKGACLKGVKWWAGIFVPVGLLNLLFTAANKTPA
jgi:hypothetical protein